MMKTDLLKPNGAEGSEFQTALSPIGPPPEETEEGERWDGARRVAQYLHQNAQLRGRQVNAKNEGEAAESSDLLEELTRLAEADGTLDYMLKMNRPLTRETYLEMAYPDGTPKMTAELEAELPEPFRKF